ncbi:Aste57867_25116 [Aphanomyces stellatus]|uniref:Aste57867_25116 protein n=1 Tax=Aphanomyces stellatus TaxID=120398 RepID=A0A485LT66_9STRA|nr:hypothetical protein As57867_025038 [Aphanomyces stellatus]VFU01747.1 Aste57867_25116 [Aphanomyces stellatus]
MASALEDARKAAQEAQKKRTDDAISHRNTKHPEKIKQQPKLAAAKRKYKETQAAALQSPLKKIKPIANSPAKEPPLLRECVLCHLRDIDVRMRCVFCNKHLHQACTKPIAMGLGLDTFTGADVYCSFRCYYQDRGSSKDTPVRRFLLDDDDNVLASRQPPAAAESLVTPAKQPRRLPPSPLHQEATGLARASSFVEGDDIAHEILKHSGLKARRPPPLSDILPPRGRGARPASPTATIPSTPLYSSTPERRTLFETPEVVGSSIENDVRHSAYVKKHTVTETSPLIEDDNRYFDYFNPPRFVAKRRVHTRRGWCHWLLLAAAAIALLVASFALTAHFIESMPLCDTDAAPDAPDAVLCRPCPAHGICFHGELRSCKAPFLKIDHECVEPETIKRDAELIVKLLQRHLTRHVSQALCMNASMGTDHQVVVSLSDMRAYILNQANWQSVVPEAFDVAFTKALAAIQATQPSYYFTREGNVVLNRDHVSALCRLQLHVLEHGMVYGTAVALALATWLMVTWQRHRQANALELQRLIQLVYRTLREPSNNLVDGAVTHLRQTLGVTSDAMWRRVVDTMHRDMRVRERHIMYVVTEANKCWCGTSHDRLLEWIGTRRDDRNILHGQPVELVE